MKKFFFIILEGCLFCSYSVAVDSPTGVYGSAETSSGNQKVFIVEQPENSPNPLGNPIVGPSKSVEVFGDSYNQNANQLQTVKNPEQNLENQNDLGDDFENTLLEANDRVYDIQSYPKADFKAMENPADPQTIYSPNVNN